MSKYFLHVSASIRKTKSATLTLLIMFFISGLLLNSGLLVFINYGNHFNKLTEELETSNVYFSMVEDLYIDEVKNVFINDSNIKEMEEQDGLVLFSEISFKNKDQEFRALFLNANKNRSISKWRFVGKHLPEEDMSIYIPDIFKAVSGYQLEDEFKINYIDINTDEEKSLIFKIKGYIEDIYFSSIDLMYLGLYVPDNTYDLIKETLDSNIIKTKIIFANVEDINLAATTMNNINDYLEINHQELMTVSNKLSFHTLDLELVRMVRCLMASMVSIMMVVFAIIVVIVCLLVVRFRIINNVEEDSIKIGSLKATGYTSKEIIVSILLQFLLIAGVGCILGVITSYLTLPAVSLVFEQQSGLKWEQGFDIIITTITVIAIQTIVALVSYLAARKINCLTVINALRGEVSVEAYKSNCLPLEKTNSKITIALAFKGLLQNMKQNLMIIVISIAVAFFGVFGIIMFYNTTIDTTAFAEVPGVELANVLAILNLDDDELIVNMINELDGVRKTLFIDERKAYVDGVSVNAYIMEDFSLKETKKVYVGHYPYNHGEIAIAGILADRINKSIGDTITLQVGENEKDFVVVGLISGAAMGGFNISILRDDYLTVDTSFKKSYLNIYLKKDYSSKEFIKYLEKELDDEYLLMSVDMDANLEEGMSVYLNIVIAMGIVMLVITLLVITLVLYFIISSSIIRKKKALGIQKAFGFTTFNLMIQYTIIFIIPIIIGVFIGGISGYFITNPFLTLVMRDMGVYDPGFIIDSLWALSLCLFIIIFSCLLSLLITWRIRKISAYALVTEQVY